MKYAIIENSAVANIAVADAPLAENWIEAGSAQIGDTWDGTQFSRPAPSLSEYAAEALNRVKRARDDAIASGISVSGVHVHTDDLSQQRLVGAALAATIDPETTINWKMSDGQFATLSGAQIIGIAQAVRDHVQAAFDTEAMLRAQISEAETVNDGKTRP